MAKEDLSETSAELQNLANTSQHYDDLLQLLSQMYVPFSRYVAGFWLICQSQRASTEYSRQPRGLYLGEAVPKSSRNCAGWTTDDQSVGHACYWWSERSSSLS